MPFCKNDNGIFRFAPSRVHGPGFHLDGNKPEDRNRTEDGWAWYGTTIAGRAALGFPSVRDEVIEEFLAEPNIQAEIDRRIAERREDD